MNEEHYSSIDKWHTSIDGIWAWTEDQKTNDVSTELKSSNEITE